MQMFKSCKYCGRFHEEEYMCPQKPSKYKKKITDDVKSRSSSEWKNKREEIKKRDKYLCQVCIRNLYKPHYQYQYESIEVHHAIPIVDENSKNLDNNNLITLCTKHHHMADKQQIPLQEIQQIIKEQENLLETPIFC